MFKLVALVGAASIAALSSPATCDEPFKIQGMYVGMTAGEVANEATARHYSIEFSFYGNALNCDNSESFNLTADLHAGETPIGSLGFDKGTFTREQVAIILKTNTNLRKLEADRSCVLQGSQPTGFDESLASAFLFRPAFFGANGVSSEAFLKSMSQYYSYIPGSFLEGRELMSGYCDSCLIRLLDPSALITFQASKESKLSWSVTLSRPSKMQIAFFQEPGTPNFQ